MVEWMGHGTRWWCVGIDAMPGNTSAVLDLAVADFLFIARHVNG